MKLRRIVESILRGIGLTVLVTMGMYVIYNGMFAGDPRGIYQNYHWTMYLAGFVITFPINSLVDYYFLGTEDENVNRKT